MCGERQWQQILRGQKPPADGSRRTTMRSGHRQGEALPRISLGSSSSIAYCDKAPRNAIGREGSRDGVTLGPGTLRATTRKKFSYEVTTVSYGTLQITRSAVSISRKAPFSDFFLTGFFTSSMLALTGVVTPNALESPFKHQNTYTVCIVGHGG